MTDEHDGEMVSISSDESAFEKCFAAYSVVLEGTRNGDETLAAEPRDEHREKPASGGLSTIETESVNIPIVSKAYLHPGRYAEVHNSQTFPFPGGFHR